MKLKRRLRGACKPVALAASALVGFWAYSLFEPSAPPAWRPVQVDGAYVTAPAPAGAGDEATGLSSGQTPIEGALPSGVSGIAEHYSLDAREARRVDQPETSSWVATSQATRSGLTPSRGRLGKAPLDSAVALQPALQVSKLHHFETRQGIPSSALHPKFSAPFPAPDNRPSTPKKPPVSNDHPPAYVTVIIDDLGLNSRITQAFETLQPPLTLSFLPYGSNLQRQTARAGAQGHEIFLHLPMEPQGPEDPGPNAIKTGMTEDVVREITQKALLRISGAIGVNNHMGSKATADYSLMKPVMEVLRDAGVVFVDSVTSPLSLAAEIAEAHDIPSSQRDLFLDNDPTLPAVRRQLSALEQQARMTGTAIGIGHPYSATAEALKSWITGLEARGITLVSASEMIAIRACFKTPRCKAGEILVAQRTTQ